MNRPDTAILRLFHERQALIDAAGEHICARTGRDEDDEFDSLFYRRSDELEAQMMALPCTCAADFAAKMIVGTCQGGVFSDWKDGEIWREARDLVGMDGPDHRPA